VGTALGSLEQAIERLKKAIGLARLRPGDDVVKVAAHERGHLSSARPWSA
jgi:hypothetical protein